MMAMFLFAKTSNKTSICIYGPFIPWLFGIKSGGAGAIKPSSQQYVSVEPLWFIDGLWIKKKILTTYDTIWLYLHYMGIIWIFCMDVMGFSEWLMDD